MLKTDKRCLFAALSGKGPRLLCYSGLLSLGLLSGCASTSGQPSPVSDQQATSEIMHDDAMITHDVAPDQGPDLASYGGDINPSYGVMTEPHEFIGINPAVLEVQTGKPTLVRVEGENRFHRYDLGTCRLYAILTRSTDGSYQISALETGHAEKDLPDPTFLGCVTAST